MNKFYIRTCDVVKLDLVDARLSEKIDKAVKIAGKFAFKSVEKRLSASGFESNEIGSEIYITIDEKNEIIYNKDTKKYSFTDESVGGYTYGFLMENNGIPFIMYSDSGNVQYKPYDALSESILSVHRNSCTENDMLRNGIILQFLMPDLVHSMSDKANNMTVADKIPGNTSLNYVMLILGLCGLKVPDDWAISGATNELINDCSFGFRKLLL